MLIKQGPIKIKYRFQVLLIALRTLLRLSHEYPIHFALVSLLPLSSPAITRVLSS